MKTEATAQVDEILVIPASTDKVQKKNCETLKRRKDIVFVVTYEVKLVLEHEFEILKCLCDNGSVFLG